LPARTIRVPATVTYGGCLLLAVATGIPAVLAPHYGYGPRLPLALAFTLFTPGYLLVCATFPTEESLGHLARISMSLATSFPLIIVLTILLHLTPFARSGQAQLLATDALVMLLVIAATLRQRGSTAAPLTYALSLRASALRRDPFILAALALVVVMAGAALDAWRNARSEQATSFSLAMGETAANPIRADYVILEVQSRERSAHTFYIDVTWRGNTIGASAPFALQPGQTQQVSIKATPPPGNGPVPIDVTLMKDGADRPYRQLHIWMRTIPFRAPE